MKDTIRRLTALFMVLTMLTPVFGAAEAPVGEVEIIELTTEPEDVSSVPADNGEAAPEQTTEPSEDYSEEPAVEPVADSAGELAAASSDEPGEELNNEPPSIYTAEPAEGGIPESTPDPVENTAEDSDQETAAEFTEEPDEGYSQEPTAAPDEESVSESTDGSAAENTDEPVEEPSVEATVEPSVEATAEPVVGELVEEPAAEPAPEPVMMFAAPPADVSVLSYRFSTAEELAAQHGMSVEELAAKAGISVEELNAMTPEQLDGLDVQLNSNAFVIENGVLVEYAGTAKDVVIPEGVTSIGSYAFTGKTVQTVQFPGTLTTICDFAFDNCMHLQKVYIPDSVTYVGAYAFNGCSQLTDVVLPSGLTYIGDYMFSGCSKLTSVNIPSGVAKIGRGAFQGCGQLGSVTLPAGLKVIDEDAFSGARKLDYVVLPEGLESIGNFAFRECRLTEIIVPDSVTYMGVQVFEYSGLVAAALPANMEQLPENTFAQCYNLELVVLPDNLKIISGGAFANCSSLQMAMLPETVISIGTKAFWFCEGLEMIYIPRSMEYIGEEAFMFCNNANLVAFIPSDPYLTEYFWNNYIPFYYYDVISYLEYQPAQTTLAVGQKYVPELYADFPDQDTVTYTTSNKKVATVDAEGTVTAKGTGTAKITAKSKKGGATATLTVTVKKAPSKVQLNSKAFDVAVGTTATLKATYTSGTYTVLTWSSSDESVATVDENGCITAVSPGKAVITVATHNGKKAGCTVTVRVQPTALYIDETLDMGVKQSVTLKPVLEPEYAFEGMSIVSSDASVVSVASGGKLTAKKAGTAVITVTTDNGLTKSMTVTVKAAPTKITLNATKATMGVGQTGKLTATMSPTIAYGAVSFTSSNSKVVAVDSEGNVTALKAGSATITVKCYNGKKATCKITVKKAPSSITMSAGELTLGVGEEKKLSATITKNTAGGITWASSDTSVAAVDGGVIRPIAPGTAVVTAATHNGLTASCTVNVKPAPTGIILDRYEVKLSVKQTAVLGVELVSGESSDCAGGYSFASSNKKIVTVNSAGKLTAVKAGTATVTVTTYNGVTAVCTVTVVAAPSKVTLNKTKATLGAGEVLQLQPAVSPANSHTSYTFSSSKRSVATVDANGLVTAVSPGSATITVKTHNGRKATCKVTVKAAPTGIVLSTEAMVLGVGQTGELTASLPQNSASAFNVSIEGDAVSVSGSKVTAVKTGNAVISVSTFNGHSATCTVTVKPAPTEIVLSDTSMTLSVKQSAVLGVKLFANGSEDCAGAYTFKSSNTKIATVNSAGKITAVKSGTVRITVQSHNKDVYAVCEVRVIAAPSKVKLNKTGVTLGAGETMQLVPSLTPAYSQTSYSYSSSRQSVAKVDGNGIITAVSPGSATITVKTHNGRSASCKVTVKPAPTGLILSATEMNLAVGETGKLSTAFVNNAASALTVTISDEGVVTRSGSSFTAVGPGTATITVRTYNGHEAVCTVTVK